MANGPGAKGEDSRNRRAHPLAKELWRQLRDRGEADLRLVHSALHKRLEMPVSAKQAQACEAISRFLADRNRVAAAESTETPSWAKGEPSRRRYEAFRERQPDRCEWPSSTFIRNAFGGDFNAAFVALGHRPAVDVASRRLTAQGRSYTREEVLDVLRTWIAHIDETEGPEAPLYQDRYLAWSDERRRRGDAETARVPVPSVIRKYVGRWLEVLVVLDCADRYAPPQSTANGGRQEEPARHFDFNSAPPEIPLLKDVSKGQVATTLNYELLIDWLRWFGSQLSSEAASALTIAQYTQLTASVRRVSVRRGRPIHPPTCNRILACPGIESWPKAKYLAGLIDENGLSKNFRRDRYAERELIEWTLRAVADLGSGLTVARYTRWRTEQLALKEKAQPIGSVDQADRFRIPSASLLQTRLGGQQRRWSDVIPHARRLGSKHGISADSSPLPPNQETPI